MRIFEERQRFNQWWLYAVYILVLIALAIGIYKNTDGFTSFQDPGLVLFLLTATIPMGLILYMQLETRIDNEGIKLKYIPFGFSEKYFSWKEINECYVRKYNPFVEYGGWGIRGSNRRKAYNVTGYLGIQIATTAGEKFLIGTQQPDAAKAVVKYYQNKINNRSKTF